MTEVVFSLTRIHNSSPIVHYPMENRINYEDNEESLATPQQGGSASFVAVPWRIHAIPWPSGSFLFRASPNEKERSPWGSVAVAAEYAVIIYSPAATQTWHYAPRHCGRVRVSLRYAPLHLTVLVAPRVSLGWRVVRGGNTMVALPPPPSVAPACFS